MTFSKVRKYLDQLEDEYFEILGDLGKYSECGFAVKDEISRMNDALQKIYDCEREIHDCICKVKELYKENGINEGGED